MSGERIRIGILGASGYTGAELLRLLGDHPRAEIRALTAERQAGKAVGEVFAQLAVYDLPRLVKIEDVDVAGLDVVFCCLPLGGQRADLGARMVAQQTQEFSTRIAAGPENPDPDPLAGHGTHLRRRAPSLRQARPVRQSA